MKTPLKQYCLFSKWLKCAEVLLRLSWLVVIQFHCIYKCLLQAGLILATGAGGKAPLTGRNLDRDQAQMGALLLMVTEEKGRTRIC